MPPVALAGGAMFHALLISCLSEQRTPTDEEINVVASKIWQDGFAPSSGMNWNDLEPESLGYTYVRNAAKMALGVSDPH